jgi:hypothetical protein
MIGPPEDYKIRGGWVVLDIRLYNMHRLEIMH